MAREGMLRTAAKSRNTDRMQVGRTRISGTAMATLLLVSGVLGALLVGCGAGDGSSTQGLDDEVKPVTPVAEITTDPPDRAADVSPLTPVTVKVAEGKLEQVLMTNTEGAPVAGETAPDGGSWRSTVPLGYGTTYTIKAVAKGADSRPVTKTSSFNTVKPRTLTYPSMNPLDGQTVGVGQPLAIYFDESIVNKQTAEDAITVTTSPQVEGAFYWFSDQEVHWRPREFWAPGTQVAADIKIYGRDLGDGVFGQEDRTVRFTVGDAVIARADGATHQMTVEINGQVVRTMPISMGGPDFPSNNGVHVVTERHQTKVMDSTTFGLSLDAGGYVTTVEWATRISNGGEFVHSAPWSVSDQGRRNVSHGCINLSPENAQWFFDTVKKGDVVINTNTGGPELQAWDGFGDWQIPWEQWLTGGAE